MSRVMKIASRPRISFFRTKSIRLRVSVCAWCTIYSNVYTRYKSTCPKYLYTNIHIRPLRKRFAFDVVGLRCHSCVRSTTIFYHNIIITPSCISICSWIRTNACGLRLQKYWNSTHPRSRPRTSTPTTLSRAR